MIRHLLVSVLALAIALPLSAQECGNGLPCGPLPWSLPALPTLTSPTPVPTISITATPTPGGPTPTPSLTPTHGDSIIDTAPLSEAVSTLNAIIAATPMMALNELGTPVDSNQAIATAVGDAGQLFGYVRGLSSINLGPLSPLLAIFVVALVVVPSLKMLTFVVKIAVPVFGILRKIYDAIMQFIPG